jgi:hypothetical protein
MAGLLEGIFGIKPSDVRKAEREAELARTQAAIAAAQTPMEKFGAGFGSKVGQALSKGLLARLGVESPAMEIAKANEQQAAAFANDLSLARTDAQFDAIMANLIAADAPTDALRYVESIREKRIPQPTMPKETSQADATLAGKLATGILSRQGMTAQDLEEQGYYVDLAQRIEVEAARQKDKVKRGEQKSVATNSQIADFLIGSDVQNGILRPQGSFDVGKTDMIYAKPKVQQATTPDGRSVFIQEDFLNPEMPTIIGQD